MRAAQSLANLSASLRDDDLSKQQEGLKGFEIGFGKAKEEYRKLQEDVRVSFCFAVGCGFRSVMAD